MKEARSDIAVDRLKERMRKVRVALAKQYKGTKPFRKEPLLPKEQMVIFKSISPRQITAGIERQAQFYTQKINEILAQYPPEQQGREAQQLYSPQELAEEDMNAFIFENKQLLRRQENA